MLERLYRAYLRGLWFLVYWTLRPLIGNLFRIKVFGKENLPKDENFILAANHFGTLDVVFIPYAAISLRKPIRGMAKAELYDFLPTRMLFSLFGVVFVKRGKGDTQAMENAIEAVNDGYIFGIAPEGTRSLDGTFGRFHTGVARIALATGKPIVPIYVAESYEVLKKGHLLPNFVRVMIYIDAPLRTEKFVGEEERARAQELTDKVRQSIEGMHERYEREKRAYLVQRNLVELDVRGVFAADGF